MKSSKIALIYGMIPSVEEIEQWSLAKEPYKVDIITSASIGEFLKKNIKHILAPVYILPDHDENPTFLPGLESVLKNYDVVIVKGHLGIYAYQAIKAKWRYRFKLLYMMDNLLPFPSEDIKRLKTIRDEVMRHADAFIVQTKSAQKTLNLEGVDDDKIFFISPSILRKNSLITKQDALQKLGLSITNRVILFSGDVEWEENLHSLLLSMTALFQKNTRFKNILKLLV